MDDIEVCRMDVMRAYMWIARLKSQDPVMMDRIRDLQVKMEEVWSLFQELFP